MKKKISIALATIMSLTCLPLNLSASAEYRSLNTICKSENIGIEGVDSATLVVLNILDEKDIHGSTVYLVDCQGPACISAWDISPYLENAETLVIGDVLCVNWNWMGYAETYPGNISVYSEEKYNKQPDWVRDIQPNDTVVEYFGNGIEIFGKEFEKGIRNETFKYVLEVTSAEDLAAGNLNFGILNGIVKGDATEDETVDILDIITVNKTVLGKQTLGSYAKYVSDINENGEVDANDSLEIMKYVVGLTDTLEAES